MKSAAAEVLPGADESLATREQTRPDKKQRPKRQPPYAVILHNDDLNTFEFVIGVLRKVFHYGLTKAFMLTMRAHVSGRTIVWSGVLEVAELKADQIRSCGCDPLRAADGAGPLRVSVEPLPGE
jgi:ATP-dependent Clp protease adaptor protein ClpS